MVTYALFGPTLAIISGPDKEKEEEVNRRASIRHSIVKGHGYSLIQETFIPATKQQGIVQRSVEHGKMENDGYTIHTIHTIHTLYTLYIIPSHYTYSAGTRWSLK